MSELVEPAASAPYAAFAIAVCAIERDVRLSELTPDEIDSIVGAVVAAERERAARIVDERAEACRIAGVQGGIDPIEAQILDEHLSDAAAAIRSGGEG